MKRIVAVFLPLLLVACVSTPENQPLPNDPYFAPAIPDTARQKITHDGSIFQPSMSNSLYSDVKARRVGDIITVNLQENTSATKSAGTNTNKDTKSSLDPIVGLGGENVNLKNKSIQLAVNSKNQFAGNASANQSNNLTGSISVTVMDVLPNQNLLVRGEKWLTLNNGDEYVRLTGIVRLADISPDNQVASTKIANARIQYSGTGTFANAQQKGWLSRFFSSKWWPL